MKTYLFETLSKVKLFADQLDNIALLSKHYWIYIDDEISNKSTYIFRANNDLTISINGKVEKAKWEHLPNKRIMLEKKTETYLFQYNFLFNNILVLTIDNLNQHAVFVSEELFKNGINSIQSVENYLLSEYSKKQEKKYKNIGGSTFDSQINEALERNIWPVILFIVIIVLLLFVTMN